MFPYGYVLSMPANNGMVMVYLRFVGNLALVSEEVIFLFDMYMQLVSVCRGNILRHNFGMVGYLR